MSNKSNADMASTLEKLASEIEAYATSMEQKKPSARRVKTASTSEYGHLDSRSSTSGGDDAISRWLLG